MYSPNDITNIQTVFLGQIRSKLADSASLADELAEILNISRDSAYRRIRGETVLSLDEVKRLYDRYGLSIDAILSPDSNMVLINHQAVDFNYSLKEWFKSIIYHLEKAKSSVNPELIFAAKDIPVFHYIGFPELASFKLFVLLKSVIKDSAYEQRPYTSDVLPKEIMAAAAKAHQLYSSLPSTEIWGDEVFNATLKQIEFYHECRYFENESVVNQLYEQLMEFLKRLRREAAEGKKEEGGTFELYQNEILIPDNTIFVNMQNQRAVFINYNSIDLLTTYQSSFCDKTEAYMKNLMKNSAIISVTAEKERNRFFNEIERKIIISKAKLI